MPTTSVLVPKAAMDEDNFSAPGKHNVRSSGQISPIDTKAIAKPMGYPTNQHLRLAAGLTNARHATTHDIRNIMKQL